MQFARLDSLVALGVTCGAASGDIITIVAQSDVMIYSESGATSNGIGDFLFIGSTPSANLRRSMIRFDLDGVVPVGHVIVSAKLVLQMSHPASATPEAISLFRVMEDWGEGLSSAPIDGSQGVTSTTGDSTWLQGFYPSTNWSVQGGAFHSIVCSKTVVSGEGTYIWGSSSAMVSDVRSWVSNSAANLGWILVADAEPSAGLKRFHSAQHPDAASSPRLVIETAATGACCFNFECLLFWTAAQCEENFGIYIGDGTSCIDCPEPCLGDANRNNIVNFADITAVLGNWLNQYQTTGQGDGNLDGVVNFADITSVFSNWGCSDPYPR